MSGARVAGWVAAFALAVLLAACGPGATTGANQEANACTFRAAPTPTPADSTPTPTPTPTPFPAAIPLGQLPTPLPAADAPAYPNLPLMALPGSVAVWQDAVVEVVVRLANGRDLSQLGLVVDPEGGVLTVLSFLEEITSVSVDVPGRGAFPARIERVDPRTGATLLSIEASALSAAPPPTAGVAPGQPVLLLSRHDETGALIVAETFASPSINAPDDLFALLRGYAPTQLRGTVVATREGTPLGLAGERWSWSGSGLALGGPAPGPDQAAVLLGSALRLLEADSPDDAVTPAAVAYHGQSWGRFLDGPAARTLLAGPVQDVLRNLGEPVALDGLGGRPSGLLRLMAGTVLHLAYPEPQELRSPDGTLLGSGRYIVLWWAREGGAPDLVLCGPDSRHLGAAFATHDLDAFAALIEDIPSSGRGLVRTAALPVPGDAAAPAPATPTPTPVPPPAGSVGGCNKSSTLPPCASGADVGVAYVHQLNTHCGIRSAYFDGRRWIASPILGGLDPPSGWGNPFEYGAMELIAENSARFTSSAGLVAEFRPLAEGEEDPWAACY